MAHSSDDDPDPLVGKVLDGRYRVERLIGGGGMGRVYDAVQIELGRRCALKVLIPELAKSPNILERFRREALAAAVLGHPHIVDVTDFVLPDQGPPFLVMERLVGEALMDVLTRDGMLGVSRAVRLTVQLLDALQAAHEAGIVHRDLKPANVFLVSLAGDDEMVKLLDFGVAKLRDGPQNRKLTAVGEMIGTPRFAAPEQLTGGAVDARTDVYGAGVLLYGMLTGKPPFTGPDADLIRAVMGDEPVDPRVLNPSVDPMLAAVVARAMAKAPADRYASAQEMMDALGGRRAKGAIEADEERPSVAHVASRPVGKGTKDGADTHQRTTRGPLLLVAAGTLGLGLLLAAGAGFGGYQFGRTHAEQSQDTPPRSTAADVAAQTATCEEYVQTSCACPGEHRAAICDAARTAVISLRRSVQIGAASAETAGTWCQEQLRSDQICAAGGGSPEHSADIGPGLHPGLLDDDDETRADGAFTDHEGIRLSAGDRVEIWVRSDDFDAYLVLRNPNGRVVAVNDNAGPPVDGDHARVVYFPRSDGDFVIEAGAARPGMTGRYELIVDFGPGDGRGDQARGQRGGAGGGADRHRSARRGRRQQDARVLNPWSPDSQTGSPAPAPRQGADNGRPRGEVFDPW